jgi:hypothetical protein
MVFRWNERKSPGVPGMIDADWQRGAKGTHATISRFDMHNTLDRCRPGFSARLRMVTERQCRSGADDSAHPGISPSQPVDGRILSEAMVKRCGDVEAEKKIGATKISIRNLARPSNSRVGSTEYLDEATGVLK